MAGSEETFATPPRDGGVYEKRGDAYVRTAAATRPAPAGATHAAYRKEQAAAGNAAMRGGGAEDAALPPAKPARKGKAEEGEG